MKFVKIFPAGFVEICQKLSKFVGLLISRRSSEFCFQGLGQWRECLVHGLPPSPTSGGGRAEQGRPLVAPSRRRQILTANPAK